MAAYKLDPKPAMTKMKKQAEWREHADAAASLREGGSAHTTVIGSGHTSSLCRGRRSSSMSQNQSQSLAGGMTQTPLPSVQTALPEARISPQGQMDVDGAV